MSTFNGVGHPLDRATYVFDWDERDERALGALREQRGVRVLRAVGDVVRAARADDPVRARLLAPRRPRDRPDDRRQDLPQLRKLNGNFQ